MTIFIILIFVIGYVLISLEHKIKIDKTATALILGGVLWVLYLFIAESVIPAIHNNEFAEFISHNPDASLLSLPLQYARFISEIQLPFELGDIASTLFFLIGAMTIVEVIDTHGGFSAITSHITIRKKTKLLWLISFITFFMSAVLDNMTSSIVMIMVIRKIIPNYKERWVFGSMIIIAANSGGAWSPIGDITTIMLWVKGNITSLKTVSNLILPCLVSITVPLMFASRTLKGIINENVLRNRGSHEIDKLVTVKEQRHILFIGVALLLCIPIFKEVTHLPPFMGILIALGIIWTYTELMYKKKTEIPEALKMRANMVIKKIDMSTILFFLGILLAVGALKEMGILAHLADFLETHLGNVYLIGLIIGVLSSIVDNVPLVAAIIGMYPVAESATIATAANPEFMANLVQDGIFWQFIAYCAGVGGSLLIIGSVSGVVVMGIERIDFMWYLKNISFWALLGYVSGAIIYILQQMIL